MRHNSSALLGRTPESFLLNLTCWRGARVRLLASLHKQTGPWQWLSLGFDVQSTGAKITYTYDVFWEESTIAWSSRWDAYLKMPGGRVSATPSSFPWTTCENCFGNEPAVSWGD